MIEPEIMIHTCDKRIDFVKTFLAPKLKEQGFKKNHIRIYWDNANKGCLQSYIESYAMLPEQGHTWHLQDDILPDRRFYQWACEWSDYEGIICGFGSKSLYQESQFGNAKNQYEMFYSFPCTRIPNHICREWLIWFETAKEEIPEIISRLPEQKYVDYFFKLFIGSNPNKIPIYNFKPCIVEHIDEYIGHSTINAARAMPAKALIFEDDEALKELEEWADIHCRDYEV